METESSIWIHQSRMKSPGTKLDPVGARRFYFTPVFEEFKIQLENFIMKWDHVILIWQKQLQFRKLRAARAKMVQERVVQKHQKNPDPLRTACPELGASNSILEPLFFASQREGVHCGSKQPFPFLVPAGAFFLSIFSFYSRSPLHHTWCHTHSKLLNIQPFYPCFHYWIQLHWVSTVASVWGHVCHWQRITLLHSDQSGKKKKTVSPLLSTQKHSGSWDALKAGLRN